MMSRWFSLVMLLFSSCYYSPDRYLQPFSFANGLVEVSRDDPAGSVGRFIQFGLHVRNLGSKEVNLEVTRVILQASNGSKYPALSPARIREAAQQPYRKFVATDPRTHDLVWHPSPEEAVTLCLRSVSIPPFSNIDRVVVFPYPVGLRFPDNAKDNSIFTIEIVGTTRPGDKEEPFPKLTWEANGFRPTIWEMPHPGETR